MTNQSVQSQKAPIGLNLKFRQKPPESFTAAVDHLLEMGSTVAEIPYRFPFEGAQRRISELSGRATRLVRDQVERFERVSFHGPIGNMFLTNIEVQQAVINSLRQAIAEAALIGAQNIALHIEPTFPNLVFGEGEMKRTADILHDLAELASCYGVRLGLETEYPYTLDTFIGLIDAVDHPSFGATLDVGHLYDRRVPFHTYIERDVLRSPDGPRVYNELLHKLTSALLSRGKLFHAHIHQHRQDALGDPWPYGSCDHWDLTQGFIDLPAFFRLLRQSDYQGILICELARGKQGPRAGSITDEEKAQSLALAKKWWLEA